MNEGWPKKKYPRSEVNVMLNNRFTAFGYAMLAYAVYQEIAAPGSGDPPFALLAVTGLIPLANTQFGLGTVEAYKRTIDAYWRLGRVPSRYEGKYEGWYCQERGFQLAVKDIESGKVRPSLEQKR